MASVFTIGGRHSPAPNVCSDSFASIDADGPVGALAVGLVDDEDVGDLHDAGLERLHFVARAGNERDDRHVGGADDVDLVLADADGLDDDDVLAGGVEHERDFAGRAREPAQMAARRHAADEHAGIARVRLHPHAIAEDRAAGERARRIDRDDADGPCRRSRISAVRRSTSVLLPAPGGPVTPISRRGRCCGKIAADRARRPRATSSSMSEIARAIARADRRASTRSDRRCVGVRHWPSSCRAMTSRWISLVPSPIVSSFTSRKYFSAG